MRKGWMMLAGLLAVPAAVQAEEATIKQVHDKPQVKGSIIANMLVEHDNPFTLYPYDTNYLLYTETSDVNKPFSLILGLMTHAKTKLNSSSASRFLSSVELPVITRC